MELKIFDCSINNAPEIQIWNIPTWIFHENISVDDIIVIKNKKYEVVGKRISKKELYVYPIQ